MEHKNEKDIVFAVFLVFVGTVFLLNTTGVISWGIWMYLFKFWPVFLILGGIQIIFGKSLITNIILGVVSFILFFLVLVSSYISYTGEAVPLIPEDINNFFMENDYSEGFKREPEVNEDLTVAFGEFENISERNLNLEIGASEFSITDNAELEDHLILNSMYTKDHIEPSLETNQKDGLLDMDFETKVRSSVFFFDRVDTNFDFELGSVETKTNLNINLGAGEGEVDLKTLNLGEMSADIGAGDLTISLQENVLPSKMTVKIGAGQVTLNIPEDYAYELTYDLGVGDIIGEDGKIAEALGKSGTYKSSNYEGAEKILHIVANVGVGSLKINNI